MLRAATFRKSLSGAYRRFVDDKTFISSPFLGKRKFL
jgi:hypothetical protein